MISINYHKQMYSVRKRRRFIIGNFQKVELPREESITNFKLNLIKLSNVL